MKKDLKEPNNDFENESKKSFDMLNKKIEEATKDINNELEKARINIEKALESKKMRS